MSRLKGKTAIVTGGSRGIGKAIVFDLASRGVKVLATARNKEGLLDMQREAKREGLSVEIFPCDVTKEKEVKLCVQRAKREFGRIDICVNNAGTGAAIPIEETSYQEWQRIMAVNATGTFLFCREVFKVMKEQGGGRIVNIVSKVGKVGYINQSAYTASKHAVMGLSRVLAQEGAPYNIIVHCLCPGGVDTDFIQRMRPDIPKAELIRPEDCALAVSFMLEMPETAVIDNIDLRRRKSSSNL